MQEARELRYCLCPPIPEIEAAARLLDDAVSAHLQGQRDVAEKLFRLADIKAIWEWTESIWGKNSPYTQYRPVPTAPSPLPKGQRVKSRMPTADEKRQIHARDGYHCRFCGIPVIRTETRKKIAAVYPEAVPWGRTNTTQHAAFQAMWAQYDHILPHARGGTNDIDNVILTCAPCNFGRGDYMLEEVGLLDPRQREPRRSSWDGLERFR